MNVEMIGHERQFGAEPSAKVRSRFYSNTGDTFDHVYELVGDDLTIWVGERGSPALYRGRIAADGETAIGFLPGLFRNATMRSVSPWLRCTHGR